MQSRWIDVVSGCGKNAEWAVQRFTSCCCVCACMLCVQTLDPRLILTNLPDFSVLFGFINCSMSCSFINYFWTFSLALFRLVNFTFIYQAKILFFGWSGKLFFFWMLIFVQHAWLLLHRTLHNQYMIFNLFFYKILRNNADSQGVSNYVVFWIYLKRYFNIQFSPHMCMKNGGYDTNHVLLSVCVLAVC